MRRALSWLCRTGTLGCVVQELFIQELLAVSYRYANAGTALVSFRNLKTSHTRQRAHCRLRQRAPCCSRELTEAASNYDNMLRRCEHGTCTAGGHRDTLQQPVRFPGALKQMKETNETLRATCATWYGQQLFVLPSLEEYKRPCCALVSASTLQHATAPYRYGRGWRHRRTDRP